MHSREYSFRGVFMRDPGKNGNVVGAAFDVEWSEDAIATIFPLLVVDSKDQVHLWSASTYVPGETRGKDGIECLHAVVADLDCADIGQADRVAEHLQRAGYAFAWHTSHSHRVATKAHESGAPGPFDCARFILPCDRAIRPEEYKALVGGAFESGILPPDPERYALEVAGRFVTLRNGKTRPMKKRGWDPATEAFAQCWFQPSCPPGMEGEAVLEVHQGECLRVDELVALEARPLQERPVYVDETPSQGGVVQWRKIAAALAAHGFPLSHGYPEAEARTTCPHCGDPSPSLCLRATGERVVLHCHASCTAAQVLGAIGLRTADLYSDLARSARRAELMARGSKLELPPDPVAVAPLPAPRPIRPLPVRAPLAAPPVRTVIVPLPVREAPPLPPQRGVTQ